ncbi:hypothetical protein ABT330_14530 [Streptomyces sp. NPDC000658]|uniref:hypothetical protein n=1 Tax=Streptomyces sp. NPDC000658 TaxID=3154266 RepID=UPI0033242F13
MDWSRFAQQMASTARDLLALESVNATPAHPERVGLRGEGGPALLLPGEVGDAEDPLYSQESNVKLREVARLVCEQGSPY